MSYPNASCHKKQNNKAINSKNKNLNSHKNQTLKKIPLSLICACMLQSYAVADWAGNSITCNSGNCTLNSNSTTNDIDYSSDGTNNTLKIESGKSVTTDYDKSTIEVSGGTQSTIINEGTITHTIQNGQNVQDKATIEINGNNTTLKSIENKGTIQVTGANGANQTVGKTRIILVGNGSGSAVVETIKNLSLMQNTARNGSGVVLNNGSILNFNNSGTISVTGDNGANITGNAVVLMGKSYIGTLENSGTIQANNSTMERTAIEIGSNGTIGKIDNKTGGLIGATNIKSGGTILTIENAGTMKSLSNSGTINTITNNGTIITTTEKGRGILLDGGNAQLIENTSLITSSGASGVALLVQNNSTLTSLKNTGTIKGSDNNGDGVYLWKSNGSNPYLGSLENSGTITGKNSGIRVEAGTLANFTNQSTGTITGESQAAVRLSGGNLTNLINSGNISNTNSSNAIAVENGTLTNLENKSTGTIGNTTINNNSSIGTINNQGTMGSITNSGTITYLKQDGTMGSISNQRFIGTLENHKSLSVNNTGTINSLDNKGTMSGNLAGTINNLTNSGSLENVSATLSTFYNANQGTINTLTTANQNAISFTNQGTINTLINTGSLQSLYAGGTIGTITNSGSLANLNTSGSISGNLTNSNTITSLSVTAGTNISGSLINSGTLQTLNLMAGSINGGVVNSGNLNNLNINGTFSGNITNNNNLSKLSVASNAKFTGTITNSTSGQNMNVNLTGEVSGTIVQNSNTGTINVESYTPHVSNINNPLVTSGSGTQNIYIKEMKLDKDLIYAVYNASLSTSKDTRLNVKNFINKEQYNGTNNNGDTIIDLNNVEAVHRYGGILVLEVDKQGYISVKYNAQNAPSAYHSEILARTSYYRSYFIDNVLNSAAYSATEQYMQARTGTFGYEDPLTYYSQDEKDDKALQVLNSEEETPISSIFNLSNLKTAQNEDRKYFSFLLPYYSSASFKIGEDRLKTNGNTGGIIGGVHSFFDSGLWGIYAGTETGDQAVSGENNFDIRTWYGGVRYTGLIKDLNNGEGIFFRTHLKSAFSKTDLTIYNEGSGDMTGSAKTYMVGLNADIGAMLKMYRNTFFFPSIGLGVMGAYTPHFKSTADIGSGDTMSVNSHDNFTTLYEATASAKIYHKFTPKVRMSVEGGVNININTQVDGKTTFGINAPSVGSSIAIKRDFAYNLEKYRAYTQVGLLLALSKKVDLSINYNGIFSQDTTAHTGFVQVNWWWN